MKTKKKNNTTIKLIGLVALLLVVAGVMRTVNSPTSYKTYTSEEAGFSLKYPSSIELKTRLDYLRERDKAYLQIATRKLIEEEIDMGGFTSNEQKVELKKAASGSPYDSEIIFDLDMGSGSVQNKIVNMKAEEIDGFLHTYLKAPQTHVILFERSLTFYRKGYQVDIRFIGNGKNIHDSSPEFFKPNESDLAYPKGEYFAWIDDKEDDFSGAYDVTPKMREFYNLLEAGKGPDAAQRWYSDFDQIVDSIEFK